MGNTVIEKIDWEYSNYFNEMQCTSKANIFGKSGEIERRKRLVVYMKKYIEEKGAQDDMRLRVIDNILEEVDRYACDHPENTIERSADLFIAGVLQ
ncbi:MAG: hypothetical protein K6F00_02315 [Lachnospiraceae bacterium]|nr:hypothetical protein [Lachnospiraceae bacterium]